MKNTRMTHGKWLKEQRLLRGGTIDEVAELINLHRQTIMRIEKSDNVNWSVFSDYCELMNIGYRTAAETWTNLR